jgi:hypothetical protein
MATLLYRLPGVRFPADKDEVLRIAESNNAPRELVERVRTRTPNASRPPTRFCGRYEKTAKKGSHETPLWRGRYSDED